MSPLIAAVSPPAGGAPIDQVIGATVAGMLLTAALLVVGLRYREDRFPLLDTVARPFVWLLRVPAWAALPVALATGSLVLAGTGFYWDVAVHIDRGRDPGPFGTPAHFPILIGLFGIFASGWLALVMAKGRDATGTGVRLTETWVVPTSGLVMMACGGFALLGFPLDDVWHATFGQDVTLWGPTHLIMLTGGQLMIPTILGLLLEGRAAVGERADTGVATRAGLGARWGARAIALSGAGGILAGLTIYQDEFANGVPQYNLLFQPALLAFTAALALVFGRAVCGRGGAFGAAAFNLAVSGLFTIVVGPVLGQALPHFSTYLAAAAAVELAGLIVSPRRSLAGFTALAAMLVATLGTLGEWGWSHIWMPIPWPGHFVPSAIAISLPAALAGGLVGAFVASTLAPTRIGRLGAARWGAGAVGAVGFAAVMAFCLPTHAPSGASATVSLDHAPGTAARTSATVTFHPASLVSKPDYVQQLSWQGHTKSVVAILHRVAPGVYRTVQPLPISGSWKTLIRVQQGRMRADVPVYMPADPAIPAALIPAQTRVTRPLVSDHTLMQRERKKDVPGWLWNAATAAVLVIIAILLAIIGWGLNRVAGRVTGEPPVARRGLALRRRRAAAVTAAGVGR